MNNNISTTYVKPFLFFNEKNFPVVRDPNGEERLFSNSLMGRWLIRTMYENMTASPEAGQWFAQNNPSRFIPIPSLIYPPRGTYQTLALYRMSLSNCALWIDMGLGKTYLAIAFALRELANDKGNVTLIVCPTSVFLTWEDEIQKHVNQKSEPQFVLAHGPKRKKILSQIKQGNCKPSQPIFIITSYETLNNVATELEHIHISNIFFDESSKIKNMKSQRTKSAHRFVQQHKESRVFCLSGTPSTTSPIGFFSQYEILGRGFSGFQDLISFEKEFVSSAMFARCRLPSGRDFHIQVDKPYVNESGQEEHAFNHWLRTHKPPKSTQTYQELGYRISKNHGDRVIKILNFYPRIYGSKNIEKLREITRSRAYSVKKESVAKDLPPKTYVTRTIELSSEQKKTYQEIVNNEIVTIGNLRFKFADHTGPYAKLHQVCQGYVIHDSAPTRFKSNPKTEEILDIVEEAGEQKIVIWASFIEQIHILEEAFEKEKIPTKSIYGAIAINTRSEIIRSLRSSDECRILIANPEVAGMGLDLTFASIEIFASNWFKPDSRIQAEDRLHRIGQHNPVTVIDVIAKDTMEGALLKHARQQIDVENLILSHQQLMGE